MPAPIMKFSDLDGARRRQIPVRAELRALDRRRCRCGRRPGSCGWAATSAPPVTCVSASLPSGLRSVLPGSNRILSPRRTIIRFSRISTCSLPASVSVLNCVTSLRNCGGARLGLRLRLAQLLHSLLRLFQLAAQVAALGLQARHVLTQRLQLLGQHRSPARRAHRRPPCGPPSPCRARPASRPASASARRDP